MVAARQEGSSRNPYTPREKNSPVVIVSGPSEGFRGTGGSEVDPAVRNYVREIDIAILKAPPPLDQTRFGVAPIPAIPHLTSARDANIVKVGELADRLPPREDLLVNLDTIPGGLMIPFIAAVVKGERGDFHPDRTNITAGEFKEAAKRVLKAMKAGKKRDLAVMFHDRKGVAR